VPEVPLLSIEGAVSLRDLQDDDIGPSKSRPLRRTYYVTCAPTRAVEAERMVATVKALMVTLILSLTFRWEDVMIDVGIASDER